LRLPPEVRPLLKRPLGELFTDVTSAIKHIAEIRPKRLITVGDVTTARLLSNGLKPDIAIVDLRVMRSPADHELMRAIEAFEAPTIKVVNPAATLTPELLAALRTAEPPLKIIVEGEEDLATLPAVLTAPIGSIVVYGQPNEGLVVVEVTKEKKSEFQKLLKLFKK